MSIGSSFREALARQDEWSGESLAQSLSRTPSVWLVPRRIEKTVPLIKAIQSLGVRLWIAHDAGDRLVRGETVPVAIPGDVAAIAAVLEPYGVTVTAYAGADAVSNG